MVRKTMGGKTQVPVPAGNGKQVAVGNWREQAAKSIASSRKASAMLPASSGNIISFKGGVMVLNGMTLPSPQEIIILGVGYERGYFSRPYQDGVIAVPDCYSFDNVAPHEEAPVPQNPTCHNCRWNQFGTSDNQKGKACKEGARFAFMLGSHANSPAQIAVAPLATGRLSVMNAKVFKAYIDNVFGAEGIPTWCRTSLMNCEQNSRTQYATSFEPAEIEEMDDALLDAIALRVPEAEKLLVQPYPVLTEAPPPTARGTAAPLRRARKF